MTDEQHPGGSPARPGDQPDPDGPTAHLTLPATPEAAEPSGAVPGETRADLTSHVTRDPAGDDTDEPAAASPLPAAAEEATARLTALPPAVGKPREAGEGETVRLDKSSFLPAGESVPAREAVPARDTVPASDTTPERDTTPDQEPAKDAERARDAEPERPARDGQATAGPAPAAAAPDPGTQGEEPDRAAEDPTDSGAETASPPATPEPVTTPDDAARVPEKARRITSAGALIWVLLALLGFTLVVQLRSNDADAGLATARQEDLVGILSDLEARDQRLQQEINALEESQRQLTSGVAGREAALAEADKRAEELGLLAGTLPARGPGLKISIDPRGQPIKASAILNAVQELRGAGGEVMEIIGDNGIAVRVVASSSFVDAAGGTVTVDGKQLTGPYTVWVIGVPATMQTALQIPGGVVASVSQAGGNVTMEQRSTVEVTAVRQPTSLQYARPVS